MLVNVSNKIQLIHNVDYKNYIQKSICNKHNFSYNYFLTFKQLVYLQLPEDITNFPDILNGFVAEAKKDISQQNPQLTNSILISAECYVYYVHTPPRFVPITKDYSFPHKSLIMYLKDSYDGINTVLSKSNIETISYVLDNIHAYDRVLTEIRRFYKNYDVFVDNISSIIEHGDVEELEESCECCNTCPYHWQRMQSCHILENW